MANTNMLLEEELTLYRRYQALYTRINQIDQEWVSVPYHWDEGQLMHVKAVSEAYQALCKQESDWRLEQYHLFDQAAREQKDEQPRYAESLADQARMCWRELSDWRDDAMDARLLVQRVERGITTYTAYQRQQSAAHAAYMRQLGIE